MIQIACGSVSYVGTVWVVNVLKRKNFKKNKKKF